MNEPTVYERGPGWIVGSSNLVAVGIYAIGVTIMAGFGAWSAIAYLAFCGWLEYRVLRHSCRNCTYYGGTCAFGKGRLCALLFARGDPQRFAQTDISWSDLIPDFAVALLPAAAAIVQLVADFRWTLLVLLVSLLGLSFGGNALVRGTLACPHCSQREFGCPAQKLFNA
jgi:hypothetical protein